MSAIKESGYTITLKGKKYRLLFSLNALDEIQTKFGGYDKLSEVFKQDNPNWIKDTKWLLTLLINEGLLEENENAELLSEQQIGRIIHIGNLNEIQKSIYASFALGAMGNEEREDNGQGNKQEGEMEAAQEY